MASEPLDFSFDMDGIDRNQLLAETAERLSVLRNHYGDGASGDTESPLVTLVKDLQGDTAEFAKFPVVQKITQANFAGSNLKIGDRFKELTHDHNLYCASFPIFFHPKRGWAFNKLEVIVEFNPGADPSTRPKAVRILPEKEFQTLLQAGMRLEFGLNEDLNFTAESGLLEVQGGGAKASAHAGASAKATTGLNLLAGPFTYRVKKAKIDHSAVGLEKVFWRVEGAEFFQESDFPLVVVLQVPKTAKELKVAAVLQASRYFSFLSADLQDAVAELGRRFRSFFEAGLPLKDEQLWDVTSLM